MILVKKIFWGLIFTLFALRFNLGLGNIDFLPDFIGFYLLLKGFKEIHPLNASIFKVFSHMKIAFAFTVFSFAFSIFGIFSMMGPIVAAFFELIGIGLLVYIVYGLIDDFRKTEKESGAELGTKKLEQLWNINVCCMVIAAISGMIPNLPVISPLLFFVSFVVSAVFMFEFNKTKKAYVFSGIK